MILKWDGNSWTYLAETLPASWWENPGVAALVIFQSKLCAGGAFSHLDQVPAKNVAKYNGIRWSPLETGPANGLVLDTGPLLIDGSAGPIAARGSDVYISGTLQFAGGVAGAEGVAGEEFPGEAAGAGLAPREVPGGDAPGGRAAWAAWAACAACVAGRPPTWCSTARSGARPAHSRRRLTSRACEK